MNRASPLLLTILLTAATTSAQRADWPGFRGPDRDGVAAGATPPTEWSATKNLVWQTDLPGPGASSPIVVGDRIYVTCFSGYGADREAPGEPQDLVLHLVGVERETGDLVFDRTVPADQTEAAPRMQLNEHGFASPTPVSDGKRIWAYFGKLGVVAFDLDGEVLWQTDLGTFAAREDGIDPLGDARPRSPDGKPIAMRWGAGASPLLCSDLVIVNAADDSDSLRALDQSTGKLVWQRPSPAFEGSAVSPIVVGEQGSEVLVMVLAGSVWGLDPKTGATRWEVETGTTTGMVPTPVADDEIVYTFGGEGDAFAIRFGPPAGDAGAADRVVWRSKNVGIPSPILSDGRLFLVESTGMATVLDAATGDVNFAERLPGRTGTVYASPLLAGGHLYVQSRERGTFVYTADGKFELVAHNRIEGDDTRFDASPVALGSRLFLRSQRRLYCFARS
jgi:hypothetical protein